ncbi:hypothetical protein CSQ96_02645 [Janthinobacterium sp. BJB412]|nr:hypothetical protein CSQ96_02645 [Janthinobacterium sp. BJB412]
MAKKVLIVSNSSDLHADLVVPLLVGKGCTPFRLDLDRFPRDYELCQRFGRGEWGGDLRHLPTDQRVGMGEIGAVWARKPAEYTFRSADLSPQESAYARQETEQALFGLLMALDCYWIGHPAAVRAAMWKGEQLKRAMALGFRVPATIVSNAPARVRAFRQGVPGDIVFKSMSTPALAADEVAEALRQTGGVATTIVDGEMMDNIDAVAELACQFQEYIPKLYELRVTIIGEQLFAAKIHSQDDARTMVDVRDMSAEIRYEATTLPAEIEHRCRAFVASYGLQFGALDLIVTPDGEHVFLENNPAGQFLYIEQLIPEFKLLETLADTLLRGAA